MQEALDWCGGDLEQARALLIRERAELEEELEPVVEKYVSAGWNAAEAKAALVEQYISRRTGKGTEEHALRAPALLDSMIKTRVRGGSMVKERGAGAKNGKLKGGCGVGAVDFIQTLVHSMAG